MGKSLAGDCGRLTFFRGRSAAFIFNIAHRPMVALVLGEVRHAR
jgi:hypothetical protein